MSEQLSPHNVLLTTRIVGLATGVVVVLLFFFMVWPLLRIASPASPLTLPLWIIFVASIYFWHVRVVRRWPNGFWSTGQRFVSLCLATLLYFVVSPVWMNQTSNPLLAPWLAGAFEIPSGSFELLLTLNLLSLVFASIVATTLGESLAATFLKRLGGKSVVVAGAGY